VDKLMSFAPIDTVQVCNIVAVLVPTLAESNPRFLSSPIAVVDYDSRWPDEFVRERDRILQLVGDFIIELEHFGSTSIPGLAAKPIIDMLAGVPDVDAVPVATRPLLNSGYTDFGVQVPGRRLFAKGGRANEATHHLQFVVYGSPAWYEPLRFRETLRADSILAQQYADLKRELASKYERDVRRYGEGKADFVASVLNA
jgi:GrpB-like predicted nucleotidyltransferase (UPF0157 family)